MEVLDALDGLGSIIKKGATLTISVLAGSVPDHKVDKDRAFRHRRTWIEERHFPFAHPVQPNKSAYHG